MTFRSTQGGPFDFAHPSRQAGAGREDKPFSGFPPRAHATLIPSQFINFLLPQMQDMAEVKACLYFFWKLGQKRGRPRFVTLSELLAEPALTTARAGLTQEELRRGLGLAVARGVLIHRAVEGEGQHQDLYYLNTEADRRAAATQKGDASPGEAAPPVPRLSEEPPVERPDIFTLYEQNIGLLTPLVADELLEAEKLYPISWIGDAFKEAVDLNKRNWRYIQRILERWAAEGRDSGEAGRHPETDKYSQGKYGAIFRR